jgi:hypothetical protein
VYRLLLITDRKTRQVVVNSASASTIHGHPITRTPWLAPRKVLLLQKFSNLPIARRRLLRTGRGSRRWRRCRDPSTDPARKVGARTPHPSISLSLSLPDELRSVSSLPAACFRGGSAILRTTSRIRSSSSPVQARARWISCCLCSAGGGG